MYKALIALGFTETDFKLQDDGAGVYIKEWYSQDPIPDEATILAKEEEIKMLDYIQSLRNKTQRLSDEKSLDAKNFINGKVLSNEQLERYQYKVALAEKHLAGTPATKLQLEADVQGITLDELCQLIIDLDAQYKDAYETFVTLIEALRIYINKTIDLADYTKAESLLATAETFDATTTEADIRALMV